MDNFKKFEELLPSIVERNRAMTRKFVKKRRLQAISLYMN